MADPGKERCSGRRAASDARNPVLLPSADAGGRRRRVRPTAGSAHTLRGCRSGRSRGGGSRRGCDEPTGSSGARGARRPGAGRTWRPQPHRDKRVALEAWDGCSTPASMRRLDQGPVPRSACPWGRSWRRWRGRWSWRSSSGSLAGVDASLRRHVPWVSATHPWAASGVRGLLPRYRPTRSARPSAGGRDPRGPSPRAAWPSA